MPPAMGCIYRAFGSRLLNEARQCKRFARIAVKLADRELCAGAAIPQGALDGESRADLLPPAPAAATEIRNVVASQVNASGGR